MRKLLLILLLPVLVFAKGSSDHQIKTPNNIRLEAGIGVQSTSDLTIEKQNEIRLEDLLGSFYIGFKSPAVLTGTQIFELPDGDGALDQVLSTNGSGVLDWINFPSFFTPTNDNRLVRTDIAGDIQESGITVDDTDGISGVTGISLIGTSLINLTEIAEPSTPAANLARLYFDLTEKKLASKDDAGDVVIYGTGGGGDVSNLLTDGGFDADATTGVDGLTCTVGACSQEVTNQFIGDGALKVSLAAQSADFFKVYDNTNTQWDNQMVQVEAYLKSSASFDFCYWNGIATSNCLTYNGSDEWQKVKIIESVQTENIIGWKVVSASITDDIFVDASRVGDLETTASPDTPKTYSEEAGDFTITGTNWTTGDSQFVPYKTADGQWRMKVSFDGTLSSTTTGTLSLTLSGVDWKSGFAQALSSTLSEGGVGVRDPGNTAIDTGGVITTRTHDGAAYNGIGFNGDLALESKPTWADDLNTQLSISDASAESTLTNWETYTTTLVGITGTQLFKSRRVGGNLEISGSVLSNNVVTGDITFSIPSGLAMDSTKMPSGIVGTDSYQYLGDATGRKASPQDWAHGSVVRNVASTTTLKMFTSGAANIVDDPWAAASPFTWASGDVLTVNVSVPIVGWEAKPQIVGTFKPAVAAVKYSSNAAQSIPNSVETIVNFEDYELGDSSLVTTGAGWKYTAPADGVYNLNAAVMLASYANVSGNVFYLRAYVNAAAALQGERVLTSVDFGFNEVSATITGKLYLNKDDELQLKFFQGTGVARTLIVSNEINYIDIKKDDQAGVINSGNTTTVAAKYSSDSGQAINLTPSALTFEDLGFDTHNGMSGATYTIPITGLYLITAQMMADINLSTIQGQTIYIYINGVRVGRNVVSGSGASSQKSNHISEIYNLNAGDTVQIYGYSAVTGNLFISTYDSFFSIHKIGK